jgi:hypothetical protein
VKSPSSPNVVIRVNRARFEKIVQEHPDHPAFVRSANNAHHRACRRYFHDRSGWKHDRMSFV